MTYAEQIQEEYRAMVAPLNNEQEEAMKRCNNNFQRSQCIQAYGKLHDVKYDEWRQRHGFKPLAYFVEIP